MASRELQEQIAEAVRQQLSEIRSFDTTREEDDVYVPRIILGQTDGSGITARSGTQMGSGTVTLFDASAAGVLSQRTSGGSAVTETWWNISETAVAATTYVMATQDASGLMICMLEDCG